MENQAFSSVITEEEGSPKPAQQSADLLVILQSGPWAVGVGSGSQRHKSNKMSLLKESHRT